LNTASSDYYLEVGISREQIGFYRTTICWRSVFCGRVSVCLSQLTSGSYTETVNTAKHKERLTVVHGI